MFANQIFAGEHKKIKAPESLDFAGAGKGSRTLTILLPLEPELCTNHFSMSR